MAQVVFIPADFKAAYPAFANTPDAALEQYFAIACLYLSNEDCSVVQDLVQRKALLWMLTAHIAVLSGALNPAGAAGGPAPVGRTSSATEGSVSVSFDMGYTSNNAAWYEQTQYGALFWSATAKYRSFSYRPRRTCY